MTQITRRRINVVSASRVVLCREDGELGAQVVKERDSSQRARTPSTVLALILTLALGLAACSGSSGSGASGDGAGGTSTSSVPAAEVTFTPAAGSNGVKPRESVGIAVGNGKIVSVALSNEQGEKVKGKLAEDAKSWKVTEPLGYGTTYTWSGTAVSDEGKRTPIKGSFTTVQPQSIVHGQFNVGDNRTYGVAMPIALSFDQPIKNKAAVEKALSVQTSTDVKGSWAWLDGGTSVHWRPKEYWPAHTKVHVEAMLYGVNMGGGAYGEADITVDFNIGEQQAIKGNTQTHRLKLFRGGELIANYPVSYGASSDPRRVTRSGTHVVMAEHETFSMSNAQFGYENVEVPWAIRISNNGEFIHGYEKTIPVQGKQNVSHGCINMAPQNAHAVVQFAQIGDPVEITGSSKQLGPSDGAYYDWTISWSQWQTLSALNG